MARAVASQIVEQNRVDHPAALEVARDGVAEFLGPTFDGEPTAAVTGHLRHEGESAQGALGVKRCEDFGSSPYLDEISHP
jgi:hypothetical protein